MAPNVRSRAPLALALLLSVLLLVNAPPPVAAPSEAERVTVFAAASLKTAFDELGALYRETTGRRVVVSFAGSSALARQIEHGAPADVFVSANGAWMDRLESRGLIEATTRFDLVGNRLALVGHDPGFETTAPAAIVDRETDLRASFQEELREALQEGLESGRLAMALVDAVPAGIYGREALVHFNLWSSVQDRVAQSDNVRSALALVASGEAPLGIVYRTDALAEDRVRLLAEFPTDSHGPIRYPAAVLAASNNPLNADFLAFLRGPEAAGILAAQGFEVPGT